MKVDTDGPQIIASIDQGTGAAPTVVSDVRETGHFSIDSSMSASDISFTVRGDSDSGEVSGEISREPTARLNVEPSQVVKSGERVRVDAGQSKDPEGDQLDYSWEVDTPRGSGSTDGFASLSAIGTSFDKVGEAVFKVMVRDSDGNIDTESVIVQIGLNNYLTPTAR